jgi:hypothetical protein
MKSIRRFFVFLVLVIGILLITNPGANKHKEKIVKKYKEENPISGSFGADKVVERVVAYENYYLFSFGKIAINNESVSFGIAGFVIVYKSLDLMRYKDMMPK